MEIMLYSLIEEYVKNNIYIYELNKNEEVSLRKKIKVSFGILNESISTIMDFFNKVAELDFEEYITLYQNGILKQKENYYYYYLKKDLEEEREIPKEEALNTKIYLKKIENLKVIGTDIFEIKVEGGYNILSLEHSIFSFYFTNPVNKIDYVFSWNNNEKSWETLNYIVLYKKDKNICYSFIEEKQIKLPKIKFDEILDISENTDTIVLKSNNKIKLYFQGNEVLIAENFIQRRGNFYFFKIKNIVKIFNERGDQIKKGFKVISTLPNKLTEKVIILENTSNHKKNLLIFEENFKCFSFEEKLFYDLKKIFVFPKKGKVDILNLENRKYTLNNMLGKAPKLLKFEPIEKSNLKLDILEIPYQIERGKFYYTDAEEKIYKTEYTKEYLINLKENGFKVFYLKEMSTNKFNIYEDRGEKEKYENKKIEKIFLEKSENSLIGINLFFCIIYKIEYIENNKLIFFYETFRKKYFFNYNKEKGIDRTREDRINEYYNLIKNKENLDNLENKLPLKIVDYLRNKL